MSYLKACLAISCVQEFYKLYLYEEMCVPSVCTNHRTTQLRTTNFKKNSCEPNCLSYVHRFSVHSSCILPTPRVSEFRIISNGYSSSKDAMCFLFGKVKLSLCTSHILQFLIRQDIYSQI
jgi:hypothetical protein